MSVCKCQLLHLCNTPNSSAWGSKAIKRPFTIKLHHKPKVQLTVGCGYLFCPFLRAAGSWANKLDQFLIGLLFYFILLRHAPAVSLLIIDGMFVNAENVRRPRTSTRRRFGSHLDFLHHLHETWKSQRPQKIPLSYTCVEPTCIWKFPCGFHTSNSAHCGSGSCCTQEVTRNRIPGWRRHVTAVTPELQHTSLLMCEGSITSCSFSYKCKTWTDSWLGKGNICHLDMGIKLVPDPSIHWTCIPQSLSEYLLSVLVCVWGFCVCLCFCA